MAEHHELVAEMSLLEHMGTQERQKLAKKRRLQQLKKWGQREKEWIAKEKQLNKRLANMLNEENNGLNLKQYTTYSSSHRSKKKANNRNSNNLSTTNNITVNGKNTSNDTLNNNNNNSLITDTDQLPIRYRATNGVTTTDSSLTPNGRVHFNVGVMLLEAAARNDFDEVKRLLMLGVSPDSINHDGLTALHQCCIDASEPMMNLLLEFGANVDARDTEQWTPLHAACTCGHLNLVKILVENGADLLAVNGDGNMPFDICEDEATLDYIESQMVKRGITQEMIDFTRASTEMQMISDLEKQVSEGKNLDAANEQGVTQLHVAAANGYLSVVKFLLKHGVNVNVCDNDYWRPLHGAACWGNEQHVKIIEHLVEAGALLDAKTINDETAFDLCDNAELLERLNQLKDELETKQNSGSDRLRRTQSRTNSRVHSVRRTSVRDKNQISRREAREEALLRVESTPTVVNQTNSTSGSNDLNNSEQPNALVEGVKAGKQTEPLNGTLAAEKNGSIDQVDGEVDSRLVINGSSIQTNGHIAPEQTHSDVTAPLKDSSDSKDQQLLQEAAKSKQTNGVRSQQSSAHTSSDSISNSRKQSSQSINQTQAVNNSKSSNSAHTGSLTQSTNSRMLSDDRVATVTLSQNAIQTSINGGNKTTTKAHITNNNDRMREIEAHSDNDITACDQNLQKQQGVRSQSSSSMAVLAPINYTLSNLKKQRSDLRMRTTSIGGNNNNNGAVLSANGNQIVLDPQPASLPTKGLNRPESPSLTFRKFRGDPSEVVGGGDRNGRHKCCILI